MSHGVRDLQRAKRHECYLRPMDLIGNFKRVIDEPK